MVPQIGLADEAILMPDDARKPKDINLILNGRKIGFYVDESIINWD